MVSIKKNKTLPLIPPGEVLDQEFLVPMGVSQNALARALGVPPGRVNDIVHGRRVITADTAARLAVFFGTSTAFWINLQATHDAKLAERELVPTLRRSITPLSDVAKAG